MEFLQHFVVTYLGIQLFLKDGEEESRLGYALVCLGVSKRHCPRSMH